MDIDEYSRWAANLARVDAAEVSVDRLSYLGLGLASEAGEVADHLKRLLRDGSESWRPVQVAEELGDVAYYWAALCVAVGADPRSILEASHAKITARVARVQESKAG